MLEIVVKRAHDGASSLVPRHVPVTGEPLRSRPVSNEGAMTDLQPVTDLQRAIDEIEIKAAESSLIANLATDPEARAR